MISTSDNMSEPVKWCVGRCDVPRHTKQSILALSQFSIITVPGEKTNKCRPCFALLHYGSDFFRFVLKYTSIRSRTIVNNFLLVCEVIFNAGHTTSLNYLQKKWMSAPHTNKLTQSIQKPCSANFLKRTIFFYYVRIINAKIIGIFHTCSIYFF